METVYKLGGTTSALGDRLDVVYYNVQKYTGRFKLPEPDAELRATVEKIVEREAMNVPTR